MPKIGHKDCRTRMPVIPSAECGDPTKTPLIATVMGSVSQPKPYCLTWKCQNVECRTKKANSYIQGAEISKLRWIGLIPESQYKAVRRVKDRSKAFTFIVTPFIGDRLIASSVNLTPRTGIMVHLSNISVLQQLAHEMTFGNIKAVSPAPPKQSRGGKLLGTGQAWPQYKVVQRAGFELRLGEVGNGFYDRKPGDNWTQEEVVIFIGGQLDTVKLVDR